MILKGIADYRKAGSLAFRLRRRRFELFESLMSKIPKPLRILDVGGTEVFWKMMNFAQEPNVEIIVLNRSKTDEFSPNFKSVIGDARNMNQFRAGEFDVVFSNSVIEHVGIYEDQLKTAAEIRRVGKRYFIQTPNYYFPIEPHFLFPFFQYLPLRLRVCLLRHFNLGWYRRIRDYQKAAEIVKSIRLLKKCELIQLFPGAKIYREKVLGLTKSFILYKGW